MPASSRKKELHLCPGESPVEGIQRIAAQVIHNTLAQIAHPARTRARDVHDVRLCIKFLRAVLRLLRPMLDKDTFRREDKRLQAAAARLSFQRDITVARRTLQKLAVRRETKLEQKAALALAIRGLDNDLARHKHSSLPLEDAMQQAGRDLAQTAETIRTMAPPGNASARLEDALRKSYRSGRRRMRKAMEGGTDKDFHEWRKRAKYLFFQMGMLQPIWPARLMKMVEQLDKLQKRAGQDHDIVVLKTLLAREPVGKFGGHIALNVVHDVLSRRSKRLRRQTASLGRKIYREKSGAFIAGIRRRWKHWR